MKNPLILVYKVYGIQNDRLDLTINGLENAVPCKSVKTPRKIVNISCYDALFFKLLKTR